VTIDHATGVVIGETATIGDNVYLMHDVTPRRLTHISHADTVFAPQPALDRPAPCVRVWQVTLGATGTTDDHERHPKVGNGVFLGAKCTVLGNIEIGDGATIAAAALVNKPVPAGYTAVGVPAKLIAPKAPIQINKAK
jgi:serine O-acetyltransferase